MVQLAPVRKHVFPPSGLGVERPDRRELAAQPILKLAVPRQDVDGPDKGARRRIMTYHQNKR